MPALPETDAESVQHADTAGLLQSGQPTPAAGESRPKENLNPESPTDLPPRPLVPVSPTPHTSNKPLGDPYGRWQVAADAIYAGLWDATPAHQARELTATLHLDRSLPPIASQPISLEKALGKRGGADRHGLIESYWLARQRAAEYQLCLQQLELLQGLDALAEAQGAVPRREPSLRRRALELAMTATALEAQVALDDADYQLATHMGQAETAAFAPPKTVPYCGPYRLNLESLSPELVRSWPIRRLSEVIPRLYKTLERRAAAVVQADGLRAKYTQRYSKGEISADLVLDAINRQGEETRRLSDDAHRLQPGHCGICRGGAPGEHPQRHIAGRPRGEKRKVVGSRRSPVGGRARGPNRATSPACPLPFSPSAFLPAANCPLRLQPQERDSDLEQPILQQQGFFVLVLEGDAEILQAPGEGDMVVLPDDHRGNRHVGEPPGRAHQSLFDSAGDHVRDLAHPVDDLRRQCLATILEQMADHRKRHPLGHVDGDEARNFAVHADHPRNRTGVAAGYGCDPHAAGDRVAHRQGISTEAMIGPKSVGSATRASDMVCNMGRNCLEGFGAPR